MSDTPSSENAVDATAVEQDDERWEDCNICGGPIDTHDSGYMKSPAETFRHRLCHENGEVPDEFELVGVDANHEHQYRQYNCGHTIYAPLKDQPTYCPVCNDVPDVEVEDV